MAYPYKDVELTEPKIIGPNPDLIELAKLFLEKVQLLTPEERHTFHRIIGCIANPPMIYEKGVADGNPR